MTLKVTQAELWKLLLSQEIDEPTYRRLSETLARQEQKKKTNFTTYSDSNNKPNTKVVYSNIRVKRRS